MGGLYRTEPDRSEYSRSSTPPEDSKRAAGNQARLTDRNLAIAREVDTVADEIGATSGQVATAWVRQRDARIIPIVGARTVDQLEDILDCLDLELAADQLARLDHVSSIDFGFPYSLLISPEGQMVYGDLEPNIDLPQTAPYRSMRTPGGAR